ncbi:choice-of-anchor J domain-containing protein [Myroides indicus]|uniref:Cleaved adhesin domain-containing protein n=1 Tax=Myroides indicus TaxID=1323422 RepID=A0A4R7ERF9_9FLAO|nr:choice-of-anchor J domain-containing protein [Myroides indicus]TDS51239.1 cleaved adhesin domain-containing protein [Myroides indicus]
MKKLIYLICGLFCLAIAYGIQHLQVENNNILESGSIILNTLEKYSQTCSSPTAYGSKNMKVDQVTIYWKDTVNSSWEYYVVPAGDPMPTGGGTPTSARENTITQDSNGNPLQPDTEYEYYVRTVCGAVYGNWEGYFEFRTLCIALPIPFTENFEANSNSKECWTIINDKGEINTNQNWKVETGTSTAYEGTFSMNFNGADTVHDDWLISPTFQLDSLLTYQLTYYYRTTLEAVDFEVLFSNKDRINKDDFNLVLLSEENYENTIYLKKTIYIEGVEGASKIAWHVKNHTKGFVFLDLISLDLVSCKGIKAEDVVVKEVKSDQATFFWEDDYNTQWEYHVQGVGGGKPVGSGVLTTNREVTITKTSGTGGGSLQPNTEYEFYVRSICGAGGANSWVGPFVFKTPCLAVALPFWDGFNTSSTTDTDCWTIIDNNRDKFDYWGSIYNAWSPQFVDKYEGDRSMQIVRGFGLEVNDDWLISPTFNLSDSKYYRLKYHQKSKYGNIKYSLLLSENGNNPEYFTNILMPEKIYSHTNWEEVVMFITGYSGDVHIGWHDVSSNGVNYIDNVFFEEVVGCPEPLALGVREIETDSATIFWSDDFGTNWEYVIRKTDYGTTLPIKGKIINTKEIIVDKDLLGNALKPNTEYEFYVRTSCDDGKFSVWSGPVSFRTSCEAIDLPFWEGFNIDSETIYCWSIIDVNEDAYEGSYQYKWNVLPGKLEVSGQVSPPCLEGTRQMVFMGYNNKYHDDWLVSPKFWFDQTKRYRLTFQYLIGNPYKETYMQVLSSDSGSEPKDFDKELLRLDEGSGKKTLFLKDLDGYNRFAWHISTDTILNRGASANYIIDDVHIEEIIGCAEPIDLNVEDIAGDQVTISWKDNEGGASWEYYIQEKGKGDPIGNGTVTNHKENKVTKDQTGNVLKINSSYEFYVRTVCGNGEYSIWSGPIEFNTSCEGAFFLPFREGFNSDSRSKDCWTTVNNIFWDLPERYPIINTFEGDGMVQYVSFRFAEDEEDDQWLITPPLKMEAKKYVLKYRYQDEPWSIFHQRTNEMEILLSDSGIAPDKFTRTISSRKMYNRTDSDFVEEVIFFDGVLGEVNIGFHFVSTGIDLVSDLKLDDILIKEVQTCPEPISLKVISQNATTIELEWTQVDGIKEWEVIVVKDGDNETGVPIKNINVKGSPNVTLSGLDPHTGYTVYVRAKCPDGTSTSDWSTPIRTGTKITNDDCDQAINIPVNEGYECSKVAFGAFYGATKSKIVETQCSSQMKKDIWFEFTATSNTHMLSIIDLYQDKLNDGTSNPQLIITLYDVNCNNIADNEVSCISLKKGLQPYLIYNDLIPGKKYYLRLGTVIDNPKFNFSLCIRTPLYPNMEISESGDKYTVEELVSDVLINSGCDLTSNVKYKAGDGNNTINPFGYFNKGESDFPLNEGIVLATHDVNENLAGAYDFNKATRNKIPMSSGDEDLNKIIEEFWIGDYASNQHTAVLEFDFIPIKDSLYFEYVLASDFYLPHVGKCDVLALFGLWIIDEETGERKNLAFVPGTKDPVSVATIKDVVKSRENCNSINPEFYWKSFHGYGDLLGDLKHSNPLETPVNYPGVTYPMRSEVAYVTPGKKYRIKAAITDSYASTTNMGSAVFFGIGTKVGQIDFGPDRLVATKNAICVGESVLLDTGMGTMGEIDAKFVWYRDGEPIQGADRETLLVESEGEYSVWVKYTNQQGLDCEVEGKIKIETYPLISEVLNKPDTISVCRNSLEDLKVNLKQIESGMFGQSNQEVYTTVYFEAKEEAEHNENPIQNPIEYNLGRELQLQLLYIRVDDIETGCHDVFELSIIPQIGEIPDVPAEVTVCAEYTFPALENDQYYYSEPGGKGKEFKEGELLDISGKHTVYILQRNGVGGCYEENSYIVNITAQVVADIFENAEIECEVYQLQPLSEYSRYFTEPNGKGMELQPGTEIPFRQTIYVYAESEDGLCTDESSFSIRYNDCPIPRGISPNGDGLNDTFDLSKHGVESIKIYNRWGTEVYSYGSGYTNQWNGQSKSGKKLPDGTYYYVIIAHEKVRTGWVQINK